jgi:hypothetical protein
MPPARRHFFGAAVVIVERATTAGFFFVDFGFLASRLLRFCPLAMVFSPSSSAASDGAATACGKDGIMSTVARRREVANEQH